LSLVYAKATYYRTIYCSAFSVTLLTRILDEKHSKKCWVWVEYGQTQILG